MDVYKALYDFFKLTSFRPGQKEIISDLLSKHDVLAMLPTGAGKSICYQLPAFMLNGSAIVVSPLLSLMEDQVQQLKQIGLKDVVALNSFLTQSEREFALQNLSRQKLIYVSPEILQSKFIMAKLKRLTISLFVVDEAHCISQWGHEFRTDYLKLKEVRKNLGNPPCLAITATATKEVQLDIVQKLGMKAYEKHIYSIDRPNLALSVIHQVHSNEDKTKQLISLVQSLQGPGIIYAATRKSTEELTTTLRSYGVKQISAYHGGMTNEDRLLIQQQFLNDELQLICCTSAFGMGVNKPNIRYVIHFHHPLLLEAYLQEIGRAGRDGNASIAITLYSDEDKNLQSTLLTKEFPSEKDLFNVLQYLQFTLSEGKINESRLINRTGITEIMWRFIRFHLEELGVINDDLFVEPTVDFRRIVKTIQEVILKRLQYKQEKFFLFQKWLKQTSRCRRELVLEQFNEHLIKRPKHCCDICGLKQENFYATNSFSKENRNQTWQTELKKIFHQKEDEAHETK